MTLFSIIQPRSFGSVQMLVSVRKVSCNFKRLHISTFVILRKEEGRVNDFPHKPIPVDDWDRFISQSKGVPVREAFDKCLSLAFFSARLPI
jgi:hypothetical protein